MNCSTRRFACHQSLFIALMLLCMMCVAIGCSRGKGPASVAEPATNDVAAQNKGEASSVAPIPSEPQSFEVSAEQLLAARLSPDEASEGWIRLFDGHTLFGWQIAGAANFRVEDGSIVVDGGDVCLLCTSMPWKYARARRFPRM